MKIAILTQPLKSNYGGILQAFALQHFLEQDNNEVKIVRYRGNQRFTFRTLLSIAKRFLLKFICHKKIDFIAPLWLYSKSDAIIHQNMLKFIQLHLNTTPYLRRLKALNKMQFDAYIVGSDQVWRPKNNKFTLYDMYLSFAKNKKIKRIAYSASFGVSTWEYSPKQTALVSKLAQQFDAISVREASGIMLCKQYLKVDAKHLIDPTMLLTTDDYRKLIATDKTYKPDGELFVYILDSSAHKENRINEICTIKQCHSFTILPKKNHQNPVQSSILPSVNQWLRSFAEAEFVLTDSFHGTVFSILFNKPFLVCANRTRGVARFESLLSLFQLEHCLIEENSVITPEMIPVINWDKVNNLLNQYRFEASNFLQSALNS